MSIDYYPFITLLHHIICIFLALLSLKFFIKVAFYGFFENLKFSPVLKLYLIFIIIWSLISLINRAYSIAFWRPTGSVYDARILFWLGFVCYMLGYVGTVLEICICIERCFAILFPMQYSRRLRNCYCFGVVFTLAAYVGGYIWINETLDVAPRDKETTCIIFGCMFHAKYIYASRFATVGTNVVGGIVLYILVRTKLPSQDKRNKRISKTILIIIASTAFFEISPTGLSWLVRRVGFKLWKDSRRSSLNHPFRSGPTIGLDSRPDPTRLKTRGFSQDINYVGSGSRESRKVGS